MSAAKIARLTPEQERRLVLLREEWRAVGTRVGHDRECEALGRAAIEDAYREVGLAPPALILWAQSPLQALRMHWALREKAVEGPVLASVRTDRYFWSALKDQLEDLLRRQLEDQLDGQIRGGLEGQLRRRLKDELRRQLERQLDGQLAAQLQRRLWDQASIDLEYWFQDQIRGPHEEQLRSQLVDQLCAQLGDQHRGQLWDRLGSQLWDEVRRWGGPLRANVLDAWRTWWSWGQCEAYWICFYRACIDIGVRVTDDQERQLRIWERLARAAFLVLSWSGLAILVQHPTVARFDERQRLHAVDGPALAWADGYAVYAVSGVRLRPERGAAMASGPLTAKRISEEPNAEARRVLVDLYNAGDTGRYLRDLGATVIHEDKDALGRPRRLLRVEQPGDEPIVAIEVTNATPEPDGTWKRYTLRCHPELRPLPVPGVRARIGAPQAMTCQNAIASTYGYRGEDFQLDVET